MTDKKRRKKLLISITALVLVAATGLGIWFGIRAGAKPVLVYSFYEIGMTEFWGDAQESYGMVFSDKIQTEFLSETQTVTDVKVKAGDTVKKGDVLFTFDTTLDALSLERKRLEIEKIKIQIRVAEERLQDTRDLVPYVPPKEKEPEKPDLGEQLKNKLYKISENVVYDGSTQEAAMICWLKKGTPISDAILQELYETSMQYQYENMQNQMEEAPEGELSSASALPQTASEGQGNPGDQEEAEEQKYRIDGFFTCNGETVKADNLTIGAEDYLIRDTYRYEEKTYWLESAVRKKDKAELKDLKIDAYPQNADEQEAWKELWQDGVEVRYMRAVSVEAQKLQDNQFVEIEDDSLVQLEAGEEAVLMFRPQIGNPPDNLKLQFEVTPADGILKAAFQDGFLLLSGKPEELTAKPVDYTVTAKYTFIDNHDKECAVNESFKFSVSVVSQTRTKAGEFFVIFKTTDQNYLKETPTVWQGAKVIAYEEGTFDMQLFDATGFADHTLPVEEDVDVDVPDVDPDQTYTAEQILEMQKQLYATIKEQNEKLKMEEFEYQIMERELNDGNVYAKYDGKVVSLIDAQEAFEQEVPFIKVSGGGGFYVSGSVSELEKDNLELGQEVSVSDWNTGKTYNGKVVSIGDFPTEDEGGWNGMGNPNASAYPFKAFVGEEADLQTESYVSVSYSTTAGNQGIYLEKAFVRTENGRQYVYVQDAEGRLEKRTIKVGKVLWGSYYEIVSGLTAEDFLAFPYGKNVKPGAITEESDISTLYRF